MNVGCEIYVDGTLLADGRTGERRAPVAVSGLAVKWGRATTVDQPAPSTCTVELLDRQAGSVRAQDLVFLGSLLVVWAVADTDRRVVFAGRVTDLDLDYPGGDGAVLAVIAADLLADLANRYVGAEPWAQETLSARAGRILGAVSSGGGSRVEVDPRPAALSVSRMDVDRQAAANLLRELAQSGGAVLWVVAGADGVPYLHIEDPSRRPGLWVLDQGPDGLWRPYPSAAAGRPLDACTITRDSVTWQRATADLVTRVTVRWMDQTTTPDTTERSVGVVDPAPEVRFGARGLSVGTILTTAADATAAANLLIATHKETQAWRADGLEWDLAATATPTPEMLALAVDLLDNQTRYGLSVALAPLPDWTPAGAEGGMYVDGGAYRFAGGRWILSLVTTSAVGSGDSITYVQTPRSIRYQDVAPEVSYLDLIGVAAPPALGQRPAGQPKPGRGPAAGQHSHLNDYGFPVPDATDPYCDTPAALSALAAAIEPKLSALPIQYVAAAEYTADANGDVVVDLSATFTAIGGAVVGDQGPAIWDSHLFQWVSIAGEAPGIVRIRVLLIRPPTMVMPNLPVQFSLVVWGTPK